MADTTLLNGFQSSRELWNKKSKTVIMKFRFNLEYRSCWNSLISETFKYCSIPLTLLYFYYCFINYIAKSEDEENSMLGCSNSLCSHGLFFHLACVGLWRAPGRCDGGLVVQCRVRGHWLLSLLFLWPEQTQGGPCGVLSWQLHRCWCVPPGLLGPGRRAW